MQHIFELIKQAATARTTKAIEIIIVCGPITTGLKLTPFEQFYNHPPSDMVEPINLVADATIIEKNCIVDGTRTSYINRLIELILWFYSSPEVFYKNVLTETAIRELDAAVADAAVADTAGSRGSGRSRNQGILLRDTARRLLKKMKRNDPSSSPIRLELNEDQSDNVFNYQHLVGFFATKQKTETVDAALAEKFQKKLQELTNTTDEDNQMDESEMAYLETIQPDQNGQVKVKVRLEATTYDGFRSAVAYLYKTTGVQVPQELTDSLQLYIKGSKRLNLAAKQTLGLKIMEGKRHMTPVVFEKFAQILFESPKPEHVFAHCFFILDWNLMKRAENCVNANVTHISFRNDSLVFEFAKSKSNQDGEEHLGPWHIYANPFKPHICPVLALARYLFTFPHIFKGKKSLFEGSNQYNRYSKIFMEVLAENEEEFKRLGVSYGDLGTHSARKGVGTLIAAGCTVSPPIVSLCLRMGWTIGGVKERYLKLADAGDQAVGRRANLSDPHRKEFAVSNPYFDFTSIDDPFEREERKKEIDNYLKERLSYDSVDDQGRDLAKVLFASICYHYDYLDSHIHANCPFRQSAFFNDVPRSIKNLSRIAFPWTSTADTPTFTGIPPHINLMVQLAEVQTELKALKSSIVNTLVEEMNTRGFGCTSFYTNHIEEEVKKLSNRIEERTNAILSRMENFSEVNNNGDMRYDGQEMDEMFDFVNELVEDDHDELQQEPSREIENANLRHERLKRKRDDSLREVKKEELQLDWSKVNLLFYQRIFSFPTCHVKL